MVKVVHQRPCKVNRALYFGKEGVDKKAGKVDGSILDKHYVNVYFTSTPSSTRVLDTSLVAKC